MNKQAGNVRKILKAFAVSFVALLLICLIIALFKPKTYEVSRSQEIQAPISKVYSQMVDLSRWKEWSPWYKIEPTAAFTFQGNPEQIGSSLAWDGKIIGVGRMTITEVTDKKAVFAVDIVKPRKLQSTSIFTFESIQNGTKVTWSDRGNLSYPIGRLFKQNIEAMLGRDFEDGLSKIKQQVEETK